MTKPISAAGSTESLGSIDKSKYNDYICQVYSIQPRRFLSRKLLLFLPLLFSVVPMMLSVEDSENSRTELSSQVRSELAEYRDRAMGWLLQQKAPNEIVPDPLPWRRNLVISYRIPENDPAAIAFTMTGRYLLPAETTDGGFRVRYSRPHQQTDTLFR